jgi:hypothetical protein
METTVFTYQSKITTTCAIIQFEIGVIGSTNRDWNNRKGVGRVWKPRYQFVEPKRPGKHANGLLLLPMNDDLRSITIVTNSYQSTTLFDLGINRYEYTHRALPRHVTHQARLTSAKRVQHSAVTDFNARVYAAGSGHNQATYAADRH